MHDTRDSYRAFFCFVLRLDVMIFVRVRGVYKYIFNLL